MTLYRVRKSHALLAQGLALLGAPARAESPQGKEPAQAAQFTVRVPPGAQVWFGDAATTSTGATRVFHSPPLQAGRPYYYRVRVRWQEGGRPMERTRLVHFRAGDQLTLDFGATTVRSYLEPPAPAARAATPAAPAVDERLRQLEATNQDLLRQVRELNRRYDTGVTPTPSYVPAYVPRPVYYPAPSYSPAPSDPPGYENGINYLGGAG